MSTDEKNPKHHKRVAEPQPKAIDPELIKVKEDVSDMKRSIETLLQLVTANTGEVEQKQESSSGSRAGEQRRQSPERLPAKSIRAGSTCMHEDEEGELYEPRVFMNPLHHTTSLKPAGTRSASDLPGMDGCPEIEPSDLLSVRALEDIEKNLMSTGT